MFFDLILQTRYPYLVEGIGGGTFTMQAQPTTPLLDSESIAADCRIGEARTGASWKCSYCNRGCMHRAHRASYLDFFLSMAGIYPTACCNCRARTHRLFPERLAVRLCVVSVALAFIVICEMQRPAPVVWDDSRPASAVALNPQGNSKSLPTPAGNRYASTKGPNAAISYNPQGPPPIK
jgi:hypothetical protein